MAHLDLVLQVEQVGVNLVLRQGGERHRGDELAAALGQNAGHLASAAADQAHELARLVGGDTSADHEQHFGPAHAKRLPLRPSADQLVHETPRATIAAA